MTEKVDPKEYEAAWESVLDCVDGMKEEFSWSKDVITKMLRELAEKVESEEFQKGLANVMKHYEDKGFTINMLEADDESQLNKLAKDPKAIASLELMRKDIRDGKRAQYDARNYWHNGKIDQIFQEARRKAWASIMEMPEVAEVIAEQKENKRQKYLKKVQSNDLLNIYK